MTSKWRKLVSYEKSENRKFNWRLLCENWKWKLPKKLRSVIVQRLNEQNIVDIKDFYQQFSLRRTSETLMCIVSGKLFKYGICFLSKNEAREVMLVLHIANLSISSSLD